VDADDHGRHGHDGWQGVDRGQNRAGVGRRLPAKEDGRRGRKPPPGRGLATAAAAPVAAAVDQRQRRRRRRQKHSLVFTGSLTQPVIISAETSVIKKPRDRNLNGPLPIRDDVAPFSGVYVYKVQYVHNFVNVF